MYKNKQKMTIKTVSAPLQAARGQMGNAVGEGEVVVMEEGEEVRRKGEEEGKVVLRPGTAAVAGTSFVAERGKTAEGGSGERSGVVAAERGKRVWHVEGCNGETGEKGGAGSG